jgi:hypothetical protein
MPDMIESTQIKPPATEQRRINYNGSSDSSNSTFINSQVSTISTFRSEVDIVIQPINTFAAKMYVNA